MATVEVEGVEPLLCMFFFQIRKQPWVGVPEVGFLRAASRHTLALAGVPKCRRAAICLDDSVVSWRRHSANSSLPGSRLRPDANPGAAP